MIAAAYKWAAGDFLESHRPRDLAELIEFLRWNIADDRQILLTRLQVLAERQEVDVMVEQLPEGVYLTGMKQTGSRVEIRGVAQSSTRVSALMRQIDASDWLSDPEVERVETTQSGASRQAEFIVYLKQERSGSEMEEGE